jgi:hypothetical protein
MNWFERWFYRSSTLECCAVLVLLAVLGYVGTVTLVLWLFGD